jgi:hypothetical protein
VLGALGALVARSRELTVMRVVWLKAAAATEGGARCVANGGSSDGNG